MKLKYALSFMEIGGSPMAVVADAAAQKRCVLHMNETTADILKALEQDVTEDAVVSALATTYDASEAEIRKSVAKVLDILRENGMLEE